ncbi:YtpR family tRNA-binding protein [Paucilactobacillus suebicus]|uniref:Phenylalanine--tRNA ligase subunit beta n=1 Tax=Paucilactobacillus suebicus DSM 5007 = KCTC 3549 TaxID=1423807 RepID=A0A0R1W6W1_9LACO|nr:DUF4479 and tRNA-binding domain-containing protein [Paucilactobacillus suebicus]KRM13250.1 phenylalanine--tRNA ligase subunit beta [Paucilactobacillus suebicus DSM 5007 = KCTC 3549]
MLIASYNPHELGDILVVITAQDTDEQVTIVHDNIAQVKSIDGKLLGYNFLNVSEILGHIKSNGQIKLDNSQVDQLNKALKNAGFKDLLEVDLDSKFVVGYVEELEDHPKSDHLHITSTQIDNGKKIQIVCGSPNIANHVKVVVAKIGAMMPSGQIIWPGQLRGIDSNGMICSGRELRVKNAPQKPGALILPDDFQEVGEPFDFAKADHLFS